MLFTFLLLLLVAMCFVSALYAAPVTVRADDYSTKGTLLLDALTYPKVVPNSRNAVLVLICNKGEVTRASTDVLRDEFLHYAESSAEGVDSDSVLFAQVIVNGAQNRILSEKIGVLDSDAFRLPQVFLYPPGSETSIPFPRNGDNVTPLTMTEIGRFVKQHTGISIGNAPGTIAELNAIAEKFITVVEAQNGGESSGPARAVIAEGNKIAEGFDGKDKETAETYIKTMEKILEKGQSWVNGEISRLQSILDSSKVSEDRKVGFRQRVLICQQFVKP